MSCKIKCREYDEEETFPFMFNDNRNEPVYGNWPCSEKIYEAWSYPEEIEDAEFNTVILLNGNPVLVIGCHFDFINEHNKEIEK